MSDTPILWEETVQPGATWSHVLKRGTRLRLTETRRRRQCRRAVLQLRVPGGALQHAGHAEGAAHRAAHRGLRAVFRYGPRAVLDHGRHGRAGTTRSAAAPMPRWSRAKYGEARYQECRNEYHKNALDSFLVELGKWGLGPRDLVAEREFLQPRRRRTRTAAWRFTPAIPRPGAYVELRAEMNVLVDPQHLPASAGPESEIRAQAGAALDPPRARARPPTTPAASRGRRTGAASP